MTWRKRIFLNLIPICLVLAAVCVAILTLSRRELLNLYGLVLLALSTGRFVTLLPVIHRSIPFSTLLIVGTTIFTESCIAMFLALNIDLLYQLPWIGVGLERIENQALETLSGHKWIHRMTVIGLVLFVSLPFPGTGAFGGTTLARLIGLNMLESVISVIIGTIIGTYVMALGAHTIVTLISPLRDSDWIWGIRIGITTLIILVLSWLGQRVTKKQH